MAIFNVKNATALVTGANRGIGRAYVEALAAAGAAKVYAAARNPESVSDLVAANPEKIEPLQLDITDPRQVEAAARRATDVTLLINNAGVATSGPVLAAPDLQSLQFDINVNVFGAAAMARAFAPTLVENKGVLVNVNSVASLVNFPIFGGYSASKAALHSITQNLRAELEPKGVFVAGVYPGPIDTDMAKPLDLPKEPASAVAEATLKGLAEGQEDIFPDAAARELAASLARDPKAVERANRAQIV